MADVVRTFEKVLAEANVVTGLEFSQAGPFSFFPWRRRMGPPFGLLPFGHNLYPVAGATVSCIII
jgi:hypothetical protein